MLYEEAKAYIDSISKYGSILGLKSITCLLRELRDPQDDLTFIHIAGTNGKGSVLAYLSSILTEAGFRTGRYISPTVMGYLERFQIDGAYMSREEFGEIMEEVMGALLRLQKKGGPSPTVFELETAAAFVYFKRHRCDYVVLEAGLGGLKDATNVIENTKLCIFTPIGMDHMDILGDTLEEIACNKAGIIKKGAIVVAGVQKENVYTVLEQKAGETDCPFIKAQPSEAIVTERALDRQRFSYKEYQDMEIPLAGDNQIDNVVTALEAVRALCRLGEAVSDKAVRDGLLKTCWPGRFMVLSKDPLIIVDGAHNEDAARSLFENVTAYLNGKRVIGIVGMFQDKDYEKITEIMAPCLACAYVVDLPDKDRSLDRHALCQVLLRHHVRAEPEDGIMEALKHAIGQAGDGDAIVVFGSLSYLGDVIRNVPGFLPPDAGAH